MTTTRSAQTPPSLSDSAPQILATEHWGLLSGRALLWNDAAARTSVFLNVLSASVVGLALVADATDFGEGFALFALVLFPLVLFLGLTTFARLMRINVDEALHVTAMNRLRHGYMDIAPELAPYFTSKWHDDVVSVNASMTLSEAQPRHWLDVFATAPMVIATIDAIIAAAGSALIAGRLGASTAGHIAVGAAVLVATWAGLFAVQIRIWMRAEAALETRFPRPAED